MRQISPLFTCRPVVVSTGSDTVNSSQHGCSNNFYSECQLQGFRVVFVTTIFQPRTTSGATKHRVSIPDRGPLPTSSNVYSQADASHSRVKCEFCGREYSRKYVSFSRFIEVDIDHGLTATAMLFGDTIKVASK